MKAKLNIVLITFIFIAASCGSTKNTTIVDPILGDWNIMTENTPQGDIESVLTITKNTGGVYVGSLNIDADVIPLQNLMIANGLLTSTFVYQEIGFELKGAFLANTFTGEVKGMGSVFPAKGTKAENE